MRIYNIDWLPAKQFILAFIGAMLLVVVSLVILQLGVQAGFRAGGAGGCGDFSDAIIESEVGDTIAQMIPAKDSSGVIITKNLRIMGGWAPTVNCEEANQVFTTTADFKAYGFIYEAPITRSELNYANEPVLVLEDRNDPGFPNLDKLVIENMILDGSGSPTRGGGISGVISAGAELRLDNNLFLDNNVTQNGGGLHLEVNDGSHVIIDYSEFEDNTAVTNGAGLYLEVRGGSMVTLEGGRIFDNRGGTGAGFDIHLYDDSKLIIQNVAISQNNTLTSDNDGGGGRIVMEGGQVSIINSSFSQNEATRYGGGLYIEMDGGEVLIEDSKFQNNSALSGGGLYINSVGSRAATVILKRNIFDGNTPNERQLTQSGSGELNTSLYNQVVYIPMVLKNPEPDTERAQITSINLDENLNYIIDFEANFTPSTAGLHVHFFFDTVSPVNAGVPGSGPWKLYGGPSPFTGYSFSDWPDGPYGAEKMCILVANADHSIQLDSGNCVKLP